jgi:hypothetical protein
MHPNACQSIKAKCFKEALDGRKSALSGTSRGGPQRWRMRISVPPTLFFLIIAGIVGGQFARFPE